MLKALGHFITDTLTTGLHLADMWLGHILFALGQCNNASLFFHQLIKRCFKATLGKLWRYMDLFDHLLMQYGDSS